LSTIRSYEHKTYPLTNPDYWGPSTKITLPLNTFSGSCPTLALEENTIADLILWVSVFPKTYSYISHDAISPVYFILQNFNSTYTHAMFWESTSAILNQENIKYQGKCNHFEIRIILEEQL
jgi:hypothetical protein